MSKETVTLEELSPAINKLLNETAKRNPQVVKDEMRGLSWKFLRRAKGFYDSVLNRQSGELFRRIQRFTERRANVIRVGLKNDAIGLKATTTYAKYLEHGTKHIKAREFLGIPIREESEGLMQRLKDIITWKD